MADRQRYFPKTNARAQRLRKQLTPAEAKLWKLLRELEGFHFRRQAPVGPHVFDFADFDRRLLADFDRRLLVEVDGGIHDLPEVQERDRMKDAWAESEGFLVVHVPNSYVFGTGEPAVALVLSEAQRRSDASKD